MSWTLNLTPHHHCLLTCHSTCSSPAPWKCHHPSTYHHSSRVSWKLFSLGLNPWKEWLTSSGCCCCPHSSASASCWSWADHLSLSFVCRGRPFGLSGHLTGRGRDAVSGGCPARRSTRWSKGSTSGGARACARTRGTSLIENRPCWDEIDSNEPCECGSSAPN